MSLQRSGGATTVTTERQTKALVPVIPPQDWGCCTRAPAFRSLGKMKNSGMPFSYLNFPSSYGGFALHTQQSCGADPSLENSPSSRRTRAYACCLPQPRPTPPSFLGLPARSCPGHQTSTESRPNGIHCLQAHSQTLLLPRINWKRACEP